MPMIPTLFPPPIAPQFFRGENLINIDIIQLTKKAVQIYTSVHCDSSAENWSCSLQGVASWHLRDINNFSQNDFISSKLYKANFLYPISNITLRQRPKKSELSGWQLPTRKNFPGGVRKSFSRQKKRVNRFRDKKTCVNSFCDKKRCINSFCNKKKCV